MTLCSGKHYFPAFSPAIGKFPVREITPHHIIKNFQETAKRGAPIVAAEVRHNVSSVFKLVAETLRAVSDPVWPVRKVIPANKTQHKYTLNVRN